MLLVFLALLREPRAEGATRVPPTALGRVPGLEPGRKWQSLFNHLCERGQVIPV